MSCADSVAGDRGPSPLSGGVILPARGGIHMGRGTVLGVALLVSLAAPLATGSAVAGESVIVVTGSGSVEVQPDRVTIEFTVLSRAGSAAEASNGSARRTGPILAALHALGVPDSAITSAGFAVQPSWDFKRGMRKEDTKESTATHRIRVRVSETRTAGNIVESVLDKGADRVETVAFSVSSLDSAREAALTLAVKQARGDAEVMAHAAGGQLGPLIEVTTQGTAAPPHVSDSYRYSMASIAAPSSPPSILPGPTIVSVTVLGRWTFVERK
jgi:uncharacterized protein YggE